MSKDANMLVLNSDNLVPPATSGELWENRSAAYHMYDAPGLPKCSIAVIGYNRIEKTKYSVECILNYTKDIDYELILIDNGSSDGTLEYYKTVEHDNKKIIHITKNIGMNYAVLAARQNFKGKYLVQVSNDVYVTKNWLMNLLICYESDPKIGLVVPVSSNVSNFQEVDFEYTDYNDMQSQAASYNISDPKKWEERMRLISIIYIFSREVLDTVGAVDPAHIHDFSEDDFAVRLRRNGYKLILCRDTWICHDHDFRNMEDKDPVAYQTSLNSGRLLYKEKYYGIEPWDDINNFEQALLSNLKHIDVQNDNVCIMVLEGRCGTPLLEIRNILSQRGVSKIESCAFTTKAKYYYDLKTISDDVQCDRIEFIQSYYANEAFDIIVFCEPINTYQSPIFILQQLYGFLKPGGALLLKLRNTTDYNTLLSAVGLNENNDKEMATVIPLNDMLEQLRIIGSKSVYISSEAFDLDDSIIELLQHILKSTNPNATGDDLVNLMIKNYILCAVKGS